MSPRVEVPELLAARPADRLSRSNETFADAIFARTSIMRSIPPEPGAAQEPAHGTDSSAGTVNLKRTCHIAALAAAFAIGAAITAAPGVAFADTSEPSSPQSSVDRSQRTTSAGDAAPRQRRSAERKSAKRANEPGKASADAATASSARVKRALATAVPSTGTEPSGPAQTAVLLAASASAGRPEETRNDGQDVLIEAESLSLSRSTSGTDYADPTASGGTALVLNKNATASTKVSLPEFTSVVIRAKGDQYRGAPVMKVSVNGKVVSKVSVTATVWTDYTVAFDGPAGTYTLGIAFTNDLYSRRYGDRNLRLDTVKVVSAVADPIPPAPPAPAAPPYFGGADWLWKPISANPTLARESATWVNYLAAPNGMRIANLYDYSVAIVSAGDVTLDTPRYDVAFTEPWGGDPFGDTTVPLPLGTRIPPGGDGHVAVLDPTTGLAYGIWQAKYDSASDTWSGSWGGMTDLDGDGIDRSGSATAAAVARYAGVVTAAEFGAALAANTGLNHALAFSTDLAGPDFVYPAIKSDGQNWAGVAVPIPEGYRIQLNPDIDVDAIPGMTPGERVIAKTLQTHGAYVVDQGGARMAFAFELLDDAAPSTPGSLWVDAGFAWDYYDMKGIPWSQLRVLAPVDVST